MKELWKDIEGYEGLYQVSNLGRVKRILFINNIVSKPENRILSNKLDNLGYVQVTLCKNNTRYYKRMHRLVAKAFLPNPNNLSCVNHKDGNKQNNIVTNLEWCTHSYNTRHAIKNGLINNEKHKKAVRKNIKIAQKVSFEKHPIAGEGNYFAILTNKDVLEIRELYSKGNITQRKLAEKYKVSLSAISSIIRRKSWKHI